MDKQTLVYVVEDYDDGITHAFSTEQKARDYILTTYFEKYFPELARHIDEWGGTETFIENVQKDIKTIKELRIEDAIYVHTLEIE